MSRSLHFSCRDRSDDRGGAAGAAASAASLARHRQARPAAGFTLLELLVVVTIIGLLAAYVGPKYFSQLGRSEQGVAKAQVEAFARALDTYRLEVGRYPTSEEGLNALLSKPPQRPALERPLLAEGGARRSLGARLPLSLAGRHERLRDPLIRQGWPAWWDRRRRRCHLSMRRWRSEDAL
jgi:prepilin-type N-terminal cleavage/methylation domain-containing protein